MDEVRRQFAAADEVGVLFLDIDDVRAVNQQLGFEAGDELLSQLDRRVRGLDADHIARAGGDQWLLIVTTAQKHASIAERAKALAYKTVDLLTDEYRLPTPWHPTAKIGVATASSFDEALSEADARLCWGKRRSPNPIIDQDAPVEDPFGTFAVRLFLRRTTELMQESDPSGALTLTQASSEWPSRGPSLVAIDAVAATLSRLLTAQRIPAASVRRTREIVNALHDGHERLSKPLS